MANQKDNMPPEDVSPWAAFLPELWEQVFAFGQPIDFAPLQLVSTWTRKAFWAHRKVYQDSPEWAHVAAAWVKNWNPSQVRTLDLEYMPVREIASLVGILAPHHHHVTHLVLSNYDCNDGTLEMVGKHLTTLEVLTIGECFITDVGAAYLRNLTRLRDLQFRSRKVTEACIDTIASLTKLETLAISCSNAYLLTLDHGHGVQVTQHGLKALRSTLSNCGMSSISQLANLTMFDTGPFLALSPAAIRFIANGLKQLVHFRCQQSQLFDCDSLRAISEMKTLRELHLYKVQFASNFGELAALPVLSLNISGSFVRDADLIAFAKMPKLERLNLANCPKITHTGIVKFSAAAFATSLKWLNVDDCRRADHDIRGWLRAIRSRSLHSIVWIPHHDDN